MKHGRRITWIVGSSITLLGIFLLSVVSVAWVGMQRFQTSLAEIADHSLPRAMATSSVTAHLSKLVLSAERIVSADSDTEHRIAYKEIQKELAETRLTLIGSDGGDSGTPQDGSVLRQLETLEDHLAKLNQAVGQRLELQKTVRACLLRMEDISLRLAALPLEMAGDATSDETLRLHGAVESLQRLVTDARRKVISGETVNPILLEREANKTIAAVNAILAQKNGPASDSLAVALGDVTSAYLGEDGFIPTMRSLMRVRSEIRSGLGVTRSVMADITASRVTTFNELLNSSSNATTKMASELGMFTRFFLLIGLACIALSAGVYFFFRKSFIIRLENLNRAVQEGVHGEWRDVPADGDDEIATIAGSVNHFARELKISTQLAEASSKAKSSFLANMSHEIRTPMNAVIGFARMAGETELTPEQRNYINKIESSAHFLLSIINDILDFSKIEAGKLDVENVPFELRTIIDSVASTCEAKAEAKGLKLRVNVDGAVPVMLAGDPVRIFQVLNNLCDNAVKFTDRGTVTLSVTLEEEADAGYLVHFQVDDQGIGLTPDQLGKLFQPFTQADTSTTRRFGGTGLGLTISKYLCEHMGGELRVTSEFGRGSSFFFTLPLARTAQLPDGDDAHEESGQTVNLAETTLLVVEDNLINQEIILALLEKTGAGVDLADNGQEALDKAGARRYDLVLMDIQMPVMDGIAATRAIREFPENSLNRDVPIIAMTAHVMSEDVQSCLDAGMNDHVAKPIEPERLYEVLRRWLNG